MSQLRAGLELTVLELDSGGVARSAQRLAHELGAREDVELVTFAQGGALRGRVARGLARELAWLPVELPRRARGAGVDVLHCPSPLVPARSIATPLVVTVHDVLAWEHPGWMSRANVLQHRLVLQRVLPRSAVVLTSSEFTRGVLLERFGLAPERVVVAPLGVDPVFSPGPGGVEGVDGPYLVAVGTLQPRKDLETAVEAFELLAREGFPHALVVAGARGWRDEETVARLRASSYGERIHLLGRVGDDLLVRALRGADALVFASRYEGFGLPPLEAMACGTPVVAARATSVPEVTGGAAPLVAPGDARGFADALAGLLRDDAGRLALRERGLRRAAGFTWARHADITVAAYARAAAG